MAASKKRVRIAVVFGGRSPEHEVSVLSAENVVKALDPERYEAFPIYVSRDGRWRKSSLQDGVLTQPSDGADLCFLPGAKGQLVAVSAAGAAQDAGRIDILFPVLHGLHGEDGSVQGLADVARVPLAGCGILGSAAALDKEIAKRLLEKAGLAVAKSMTLRRKTVPALAELEKALGSPFFLKPARQGSSVGVSKVSGSQEFAAALSGAFEHDDKLLAEEFIAGREIECSVIEDAQGDLFVSRPGEIVPTGSHGFYSYDAKYVDENGAAIRVPADLPEETEARLRDLAASAFRALGCDGMARVDFFVTPDMRCLVNEVNTIPGFTDISMYSKAMAASGLSYGGIIDRLVEHGLARASKSK